MLKLKNAVNSFVLTKKKMSKKNRKNKTKRRRMRGGMFGFGKKSSPVVPEPAAAPAASAPVSAVPEPAVPEPAVPVSDVPEPAASEPAVPVSDVPVGPAASASAVGDTFKSHVTGFKNGNTPGTKITSVNVQKVEEPITGGSRKKKSKIRGGTRRR